MGHRGSRARVLIIQLKSVLCPANPTEIEQKFTFHMVSHLQGPKVKSTFLSMYELLSALYRCDPATGGPSTPALAKLQTKQLLAIPQQIQTKIGISNLFK